MCEPAVPIGGGGLITLVRGAQNYALRLVSGLRDGFFNCASSLFRSLSLM